MSRLLTPLRFVARLTATRCVLPRTLAVARFTPSFHTAAIRLSVDPAAAPAALQLNEVTERVLAVVKKFEKIKNPEAVTSTAVFASDLGLDSLDAVEVVMAFEDEFGIEIPDADADKILSTADAIKYIAAHPKAQ